MADTEWMLTEDVKVAKIADNYVAMELGGEHRHCVISFRAERMLFDGEDIETEDFMAFVGMLDAAGESPSGVAIFREETMSFT